MAAIKYLDLAGLQSVVASLKTLISEGDAKAYKAAKFDETTRVLSLYKAEATDGTADFTVEIPETDVSGLMEKLSTTNVGNVVITKADGTVEDGGVALADLATKAEVKTVSDAVDAINNADSGILATAKAYTDAEVKELADGAVKTNTDAIAVLNGDASTEGSVAKAVKDSADAINATIGTVAEGKTVVDMIEDVIANGYDDTEVRELIQANTDAIEDAVDGAKVSISTDTTTEGYLKTYTIKQGEAEIGKIDIAKDLVVTSGEVVVDPEGQAAGTYVKLTIANQEAPVYINVKDLCDVYTVQASAAQIQVAISETNEISATIVAGSVGTAELADSGVTTAKIADANVTLAKLADDAKNAFDAAGSATAAQTNAQTYADGLNTAMDTRVDALETKVGDGMEAISTEEINALFA